MSHSNLGDLRQRITVVWHEAQANGHKIEDILPLEMQDHFRGLKELKDARDYIEESAEREKNFQQQIDDLSNALAAEKRKVEELPDDHRQALVDLKQAEGHVEFFQNLMKAEERRSEDYKTRWFSAQKVQAQSEDTHKRIAALNQENDQQRATIMKLVEENRTARTLFLELEENTKEAMEEKDSELEEMLSIINETESRSQQVQFDSDNFEELYNGLLEKMENENGDTAAALNAASEKVRNAEQLRAVTFSETKHLTHCFHSCSQALSMYQDFFQQLLSLDKSRINWLPQDLELVLENSEKDCEAFKEVRAMIKDQGIEEDEVRQQLGQLGKVAEEMQIVMDSVADDVDDVLEVLKGQSDVWSWFKKKFGTLGKVSDSRLCANIQ